MERTWTAITHDEAISALHAATKLLEALAESLVPGTTLDAMGNRRREMANFPVRLVLAINTDQLEGAIENRTSDRMLEAEVNSVYLGNSGPFEGLDHPTDEG